MSIYAQINEEKTSVIQYPLTIYQIRAMFNNLSWPEEPTGEQLDLYHFVRVIEKVIPEPSKNNKQVNEITPIYNTSLQQWEQSYEEVYINNDSLSSLKQEQLALLSSVRYDHEVSGVLWNGHMINTDRDSQGKMNGLYNMAKDGYWVSGYWKCQDGTFTTLNTQEAMSMALSVGAYVAWCFTQEQAIGTQINAATNVAELEWTWPTYP